MFFDMIHEYFIKIRDRNDPVKAMNKLLLWISFNHCDTQNWKPFARQWNNISKSSCNTYVTDVNVAILRAFKSTPEILDFPMNDEIRALMHEILKLNGAKFQTALLSVDGKASQLYGRSDKSLRNFKFKFRPAQNHMSIYDRVLKINVACSIGNPGSTADITVWRNHDWSNEQVLWNKLKEYLMLADSGYIGANPTYVACRPRKNMKLYKTQPSWFWSDHSATRGHVEHDLGYFWYTQNPTLNYWKKNSKYAFYKKRWNVVCSTIFMNVVRLYRFYSLNCD